MSKKHDAILAINGDASGFTNSNIGAADFMIKNGIPAYDYKKTNNNNQYIGCHMQNGSFKVFNSNQFNNNQELLNIGIKNTFYFYTYLVKDGVMNEKCSKNGLAPRTMIGQKADGT